MHEDELLRTGLRTKQIKLCTCVSRYTYMHESPISPSKPIFEDPSPQVLRHPSLCLPKSLFPKCLAAKCLLVYIPNMHHYDYIDLSRKLTQF